MAEWHTTENEPPDAELVAYLDGELDSRAVAAIESRLADDAEYRQQLQQLQESWALLDLLETPAVSEDFTQTTLEMTVVAARDATQQMRIETPRRRIKMWVLALVGCVVSVVAGFVMFRLLSPDPDRRLLQDLPLIENVDYYTYGDDIAFIRLLLDRGVFPTEPSDTTPAWSVNGSLVERREQVARLSVDAKESLQSKQIRLTQLTPKEMARIRGFHEALIADERAEQLQVVLVQYNDWLKSLSTSDRYQVLRLDDEPRIERIQTLQREAESKHLNEVVAEKMSVDDNRRIFAWMAGIWKQREDLVFAALSPEKRIELNRARAPFERRRILMAAVQEMPELQGVSEEDLERLLQQLSPGGQAVISRMIETGDKAKWSKWFREVNELHMRLRGAGQSPINQRELTLFFMQLPPDEQKRLRNLPAQKMWSEVRMGYIARKRRMEKGGRRPLDRGGLAPKPNMRPTRPGL